MLTKFDGEPGREFHVTELPQFVEVFVGSNHLQNVQQSTVEEYKLQLYTELFELVRVHCTT